MIFYIIFNSIPWCRHKEEILLFGNDDELDEHDDDGIKLYNQIHKLDQLYAENTK